MKIQILNRWSLSVVFEAEVDSDSPRLALGMAVKLAVEKKIVLTGADLTGAVLTGADLTGAVLRGAVLTGADLTGAVLTGADLTGAVLTGADLTGADLTGAVLTGADLTDIKNDIWAMLAYAPREVPALIAALKSGKVNGCVYTDGECGCLVGTLAIASGKDPSSNAACSVVGDLLGQSSRPGEVFFFGIKKGDTPETNQQCKLAVEWCEEWLRRVSLAFAPAAAEPVAS